MTSLTYKPSLYTIGLIGDSIKGYEVSIDGERKYFISKCDVLNEWSCYNYFGGRFVCGGLTLKECKEVLTTKIINL